MARLLLRLGGLLVFSRREKRVRGGLLMLITNGFVLAAFIFSVEIVLILLGVENVFVPLTRPTREFLARLIF